MSDWFIEKEDGTSVFAHSEERGHIIESERSDIIAAERKANDAGRTLVFVKLKTEGGMAYYYPLLFLSRLTEFHGLSIGPDCGYRFLLDPVYQQKRSVLPSAVEVDFIHGTVSLQSVTE
jgi:hypothetical protein